jgi:hypothetical protein
MLWDTELAYFVTPKSGPMRPMRTLRDVNRALLDDLSFRTRRQRHWSAVGRLLLGAAVTATRIDLLLATDTLVAALDAEGWMTRERPAKTAAEQSPEISPEFLLILELPLAA